MLNGHFNKNFLSFIYWPQYTKKEKNTQMHSTF
nr:MAG TPA: hypothetical protein [Microviridae sp.]